MSGGGFGALDAMNKSLKNNRGLVRKVSAFERMKGHSSALKGRKLIFTDKRLNNQQLEELRRKTIKSDRIHTIKQVLKMIIVLATLVVLLILLISGPLSK